MSGFDLSRFLYTMRTTKWIWLPVALAVVVIINLMGLALPKKYEASAQVQIFEPRLIETGRGSVASVLSISDRLDTIKEQMHSYDFLSEVAKRVNLDLGMDMGSPRHQALIARMAKDLSLIVKGTDLFQIRYIGRSPREAREVTEEIVNHYIELSNEHYAMSARKALDFIESELNSAKAVLSKAEEDARNYNQKNINTIPEAQESHMRQLEKLLTDRALAQQQISALSDSLILARRRLSETPKDIVSERTVQQQDSALQQLKAEKRKVEIQLDMLLKVQEFTEKHPQVQQARSQLKVLDEQIAAAQEAPTQTVTTASNPGYQAVEEEIMKTELDLKKAQTSVERMTQEVATLREYQNQLPEKRLEQQRLTDQVQFAKERVAGLTRSLQEAKLTVEAERKAQGPTFVPLELPRQPTDPVSPNRTKIALLSMVMGAAAGLALVFLLSLLDTAVRSIDEARRLLQMPVLGVVQRIVTARDEAHRRLRRRKQLAGVGAGLVVIFITITLVYMRYRDTIGQGLDSVKSMISR